MIRPPRGDTWRVDVRIAIASDHADYDLQWQLVELLRGRREEVLDLGTDGPAPVDYPDYARAVAEAITTGRAERGILVCGSGVGASVAANKAPGIRAGLCHDTYSVRQGVEHDDMNVLVLGARVIGAAVARELVERFIEARFGAEPRHRRRLDKLLDLEREFCGKPGLPCDGRGASVVEPEGE